MPISQDEQQLINKLRKTERFLASEKRRFAALQAQLQTVGRGRALTVRPKAYVATLSFTPGEKTTKVANISVSEGREFHLHALSSSFSMVGSAAVPVDAGGTLGEGQLLNFTAGYSGSRANSGPNNRQRFFDFFWRIRDTGNDLALSDHWQPSVMLCGGHISPLSLPTHAVVSRGTEVAVEVKPTLCRSEAASGGGSLDGVFDIKEYTLNVILFGEEVL